ncbi:DUF4105 domain-containing protein [Persicirhabdus sediminis]|uniref:DUF4105 domain-containing protein n=1 Tax=Persicirhabdus sediminis TaxID=454144 RepID=A0A8J7SM03_9BACT|nr:DUF4105 domain-containing protein [Persicirhabdus sediminis]MBK1790773.1 DUF4105 domain-containing protein [Persicirhabdus sediminis]
MQSLIGKAVAYLSFLLMLGALIVQRERFAKLRMALPVAFFVLILSWWLTLKPSNDLDWMVDFRNISYAEMDGDKVTIHNVRDFDYRTDKDFDENWIQREVHLSNFKGADISMTYWGPTLICHTMMSFDFGPDGIICVSIETRKEKGEAYSAVKGFFRQFELYYVVATERDLVRLRTNYRQNEEVYLYPLVSMNKEDGKKLFLDYIKSMNGLKDRPQWYNAGTSNCTTNIAVHVNAVRHAKAWDYRLLANGGLEGMMYGNGSIPHDRPFEEIKKRHHINKRARAADQDPDFSQKIRQWDE